MARCSGCNAEIEWVTTRAGKQMPVDVSPRLLVLPDKKGPETVITDDGSTVRGRIDVSQETTRSTLGDGGPVPISLIVCGRRPHWASCPKSGSFKKKETSK